MLSANPDKLPTQGGRLPIPSLHEALRAIGSDLPPELIGAGALSRLTSIAEHAPRAMSSFGFECRLADDDPTVDLGLSVVPENGGRRVLAELDVVPGVSPALLREARWARIRALAARWSEAGSPLATWVPFLFMEFDASAATASVPVPSIFVGLDAPLDPSQDPVDVVDRGPIAAVREVSLCLAARALDAELDASVVRAFRTLPRAAWVMHVAVMLGRRAEGVRLSVSIPASDVADYLRDLGGADAAIEAEAVVRRFGAHVDPAQVDFDLGPALGPRIGFGLKPRMEGDWAEMTTRLVEADWCSPRKREALLRWPGVGHAILDGDDHLFQRHLSHVKLATDPEKPTCAKAYLGVTPLRVRARGASDGR